MEKHIVERFIKAVDLNDHGTLFAGQGASWMVEASFLSAGAAVKKKYGIVCRCIKKLEFLKPLPLGTMLHIESSVTSLGTSSITVHCEAYSILEPDKLCISSDIVFVTVDQNGNKIPHELKEETM